MVVDLLTPLPSLVLLLTALRVWQPLLREVLALLVQPRLLVLTPAVWVWVWSES